MNDLAKFSVGDEVYVTRSGSRTEEGLGKVVKILILTENIYAVQLQNTAKNIYALRGENLVKVSSAGNLFFGDPVIITGPLDYSGRRGTFIRKDGNTSTVHIKDRPAREYIQLCSSFLFKEISSSPRGEAKEVSAPPVSSDPQLSLF